jgi:hypothetical protein
MLQQVGWTVQLRKTGDTGLSRTCSALGGVIGAMMRGSGRCSTAPAHAVPCVACFAPGCQALASAAWHQSMQRPGWRDWRNVERLW